MNKSDFSVYEDRTDLVYLDSACMSLKPQQVVNKVEEYYNNYPGCSGRSSHTISRKAAEELQKARRKVASFIDTEKENLVLTSGTTESINMVAQGLEYNRVFISEKEHNSNRVVWQQQETEVKEIPVDEDLDLEYLKQNIRENDILSLVHVSNLDGHELNIEEAFRIAKEKRAYTMLDAAQSIPHMPFSVNDYEADFVAFSGHKMLGPTGTGALYVREQVQNELKPLKYGGGSVHKTFKSTSDFKDFPYSHEPGLKNYAGFIGFGEAAEYLDQIGMDSVQRHEKQLTQKLLDGLRKISYLKVYNQGPGIISLSFNSMTCGEVSEIFDKRGIAVRSGMHCVHPWFAKNDIEPTVRASLYLYNDEEDIEKLLKVARKISML